MTARTGGVCGINAACEWPIDGAGHAEIASSETDDGDWKSADLGRRPADVMRSVPGLSDDHRVHPALGEALDLVLGDVRRTTDIDPVVIDEGFDDAPGTSSAMLALGSGQRGVYVQNEDSLAERLVKVADIVQDEVTDAIVGAWPLCPEHRNHYLGVTIHEEVAVWVCQVSERTVSEVGKLGIPPAE